MCISRELALVLCEVSACGVNHTLGLPQTQKSSGIVIVHRLRELVGFTLTPERLPRESEQCLIGEDCEVVRSDLADEADLGAPARFALREILLEGLSCKAAFATEEVELVVGEANP